MNKNKQNQETISIKQLESMWKSVDLTNFWIELAQNISKDAEAYRIARAKSRGTAATKVLI